MQYAALAIEGITLGAIYALVALGFNLIYRTVGILDFAQGDKVVAGGLLALALVHLGLPLSLVFVLIIASLSALAAMGLYSRLIDAGVLESTMSMPANASGRSGSTVCFLP